jgi:arylsulfatase A-like enzyme
MNGSWLRTGCLTLAVFASIVVNARAADAPLNVVLLYADDWRHDTLGCAGNAVLKTPNLDRLAQDGVRFTHNCVTTSICGVSRATLLTGQWMSRHGNPAFAMFKTPWAEAWPGILKSKGYFLGHVGKWHNEKFPPEHFDFGRSYGGIHWLKQPDGSQVHVTAKNGQDALDFLHQRPADRPFALTVAFSATHAEDSNPKQYLPQPESMSLYENAKVPVPKTANDAAFRKLPPFIANEKNEGRIRWHWRFDTPERYQEYMKNYYRMATEVDTVCGSVIEELRKQNLLDRTLVIFTTDNGYFHGEHELADKWYPYEESIRVPLIIRDPRMPAAQRGWTNDAFTLNVDLARTILAATQSPAPATMQGRDMSPLYLSSKPAESLSPPWRTEFFYEHSTISNINRIPSSEALVRKDVKYILWPDFKHEELFDLKSDPQEEHNLAADPQRATQLVELRRRFQELKTQAK